MARPPPATTRGRCGGRLSVEGRVRACAADWRAGDIYSAVRLPAARSCTRGRMVDGAQRAGPLGAEDRAARVGGVAAQGLLDAQQLVVLGDAVRARRRAGLDLAAA